MSCPALVLGVMSYNAENRTPRNGDADTTEFAAVFPADGRSIWMNIMIQHETWTTIGEYSSNAWSAIGPFMGVLVGAWLAHSWDRKKWIADNRKDECRELLGSMTMVADLTLEAYSKKGTADFKLAMAVAWQEERRCMRILQDRIFIAERLKRAGMRGLWQTVTTDYLQDGDAKKFGKRLDEIKAIIVEIALDG
jgi:hypothetical protein